MGSEGRAGDEYVPTASMQLKGTDLCMDVYCICGNGENPGHVGFHVDGMFADYIQCPNCERVYHVLPAVQIELSTLAIAEADGRLIRGE